jgi:hypothetical protein
MNQDRKIWRKRSGCLTRPGIARASVQRLATGEPFSLTESWSIVLVEFQVGTIEQYSRRRSVYCRFSMSPSGYCFPSRRLRVSYWRELSGRQSQDRQGVAIRCARIFAGGRLIRPKLFWSNQRSRRLDLPGWLWLKQNIKAMEGSVRHVMDRARSHTGDQSAFETGLQGRKAGHTMY